MGYGAFCRGPANPKSQPAVSSSPHLSQVLGRGATSYVRRVHPPIVVYPITKVFRLVDSSAPRIQVPALKPFH